MSILQSQTTDTSVADALNHAFARLEKNRVPHGILLDYGLDFVSLDLYQGTDRDGDHISPSRYKNIYNTLVSSAIRTGIAGVYNPNTKFEQWRQIQTQKTAQNTVDETHIALSGLYFKYAKIRSNALAQNTIRVVSNSTQYDDVYRNGVWQNPYETKNAVAIAAPVLSINTAKVSVSLPNTLFYSNQSSAIQSIKMYWGEGLYGFRDITDGKEISYTYQQPGIKTWDFRITLTNGTVLRSRIKIHIKKGAGGAQPKSNPACAEVRQNITASRAYLGRRGSATLQIVYGSNDCRMRNPLIVAEGLDTGLLAESGRIGDNDLNSFLDDIVFSNSFALQNLITRNSNVDYDVVYVNWDNGTDHLQRNAFVLQEVIAWVNAQKAAAGSTAANVIIGQSMGGLITRYALRDMEDRGVNHDTSLYVSHDAPHLGAHIPLGVQYMVRHFVDRFISTPLSGYELSITDGGASAKELKALLNAPGVRQMVKDYVNDSFRVDNSMFNTFQQELNNLGYPQQTRNIALSNGSHCATLQNVTSGSKIFELKAGAKTGWLTDVIFSLFPPLNAAATTFLTIATNDAGFLLNQLPGNSKLSIDIRVTAAPTSGTREVYFGRVRYTKKLFWLVNINKTITQRSFNSIPGILPVETYPGGVNPLFDSDLDFDDVNNAFVSVGFDVDFNPDFNFIPTTSALGVGSGVVTLTAADYTERYAASRPPTGNRAIPFDNFTTSFNGNATSEAHISFNVRNANWLAEEMDRDNVQDIFDCSLNCQNAEIFGAERFCDSGVYSVPEGALNYQWTVNPAVTITGNGTNSVTLSSNRNGFAATVSVEITTACGSVILDKDIHVNKPFVRTSAVPDICAGQISPRHEEYKLPRSLGADSYRLVSNSPNLLIDLQSEITFIQGNDNGQRSILFTARAPGDYSATLYVTNACGTRTSALFIKAKSSRECDDEGIFDFYEASDSSISNDILYPNPAKDQVTIFLENLKHKNVEKLPKEIRSVTVIDPSRNGASPIRLSQISNQLTFPIYNLKTGLYFVKIETEYGWITEKLIVE